MTHLSDPAELPVLVIEDSEIDFDTVLEAMRKSTIKNKIVHAVDADEAMRLLLPLTDASKFSFILLDHNLPGMSGCDFLRELRTMPRFRSIPVILYTTSSNPRDRDACYNAGANAYHVKSVRFDECLQILGDVFDYWLKRVALPAPGDFKCLGAER